MQLVSHKWPSDEAAKKLRSFQSTRKQGPISQTCRTPASQQKLDILESHATMKVKMLGIHEQNARGGCPRAYKYMVKLTLNLCETLGS